MPSARAVDPDERATDRIDEARVDSELRITEVSENSVKEQTLPLLPISIFPSVITYPNTI